MLKSIFSFNRQTAIIWFSSVYLMVLLILEKVNPITIVFVYFIETIVIGLFNALKMLWSILFGKSKNQGIGIIFFFLMHYGFFVAIQSIFGFAIFSFNTDSIIKAPFNLIDNYYTILGLPDIKFALPAIIILHIGLFFFDFVKNQKHLKFKAQDIMFKPYARIFIQQFVVILSSFFFVVSSAGFIAALLLLFFRLVLDLGLLSIKKDSKILNFLAEKLANEKTSKKEIKSQLIKLSE